MMGTEILPFFTICYHMKNKMFIGRQTKYDDDLSLEEKNKMTSFSEMSRLWKVLIEYKYWYITENDYPYDGTVNHLIIWSKDIHDWSKDCYHQLWIIMEWYISEWYRFLGNPKKDSSVSREHYHLILYPDNNKLS